MFLLGILPPLWPSCPPYAHEPESLLRGTRCGAARVSILIKDGRLQEDFLELRSVCGSELSYYGIMVWMRAIWGRVSGSAYQVWMWTATTVLGMASGTWVCGPLATDRSQTCLHPIQAGAAHGILYSGSPNPSLLWVGAVEGLFVNETNGAIFALMSEAYPTVAARHAQNVLWNLARAVGPPSGAASAL